jgi:hypothetical protein
MGIDPEWAARIDPPAHYRPLPAAGREKKAEVVPG